jgi:hypothetical protein
MSIQIVKEPGDPRKWEMEKCCFCRTQTQHWTALEGRTEGQQVACCPECAQKANPEDVPTKKVWMRRERIAEGED